MPFAGGINVPEIFERFPALFMPGTRERGNNPENRLKERWKKVILTVGAAGEVQNHYEKESPDRN